MWDGVAETCCSESHTSFRYGLFRSPTEGDAALRAALADLEIKTTAVENAVATAADPDAPERAEIERDAAEQRVYCLCGYSEVSGPPTGVCVPCLCMYHADLLVAPIFEGLNPTDDPHVNDLQCTVERYADTLRELIGHFLRTRRQQRLIDCELRLAKLPNSTAVIMFRDFQAVDMRKDPVSHTCGECGSAGVCGCETIVVINREETATLSVLTDIAAPTGALAVATWERALLQCKIIFPHVTHIVQVSDKAVAYGSGGHTQVAFIEVARAKALCLTKILYHETGMGHNVCDQAQSASKTHISEYARQHGLLDIECMYRALYPMTEQRGVGLIAVKVVDSAIIETTLLAVIANKTKLIPNSAALQCVDVHYDAAGNFVGLSLQLDTTPAETNVHVAQAPPEIGNLIQVIGTWPDLTHEIVFEDARRRTLQPSTDGGDFLIVRDLCVSACVSISFQ